jgi:tetratricopeptide (TPR) repeat protein
MGDENNQELLRELRKLTRVSRLSYYLGVVILAIGVLAIGWMRQDRQRTSQSGTQKSSAAQNRGWGDVSAAMDRLGYTNALALAQAIVSRNTNYYYGHSYLGSIYLALGDLTNSEAHYARAYELFPDDDNEKSLRAIRKRLDRERAAKGK